jgi:glycosyltransferase involved in cell wall biosynthesis
MRFDGVSYTNKNTIIYNQPHIRTKQATNTLFELNNETDMFSAYTLKHAMLENGLFGDVEEFDKELSSMNYGPYQFDNNNYNVNCHIPVLLFFVDKIIYSTLKHPHFRPIYYCWNTSLSNALNIRLIKKLICKYNPRMIISCDNDNLIVNHLQLPFEYRKRWIKNDDIRNIDPNIIERVISTGIFDHPNALENPLVSVITCTYESKDRILKPYHSLLSQTYTNWEWIIIDDSLSDDTWKTLQNFAENDYRIQIYKRPKNDGSIGKNKQFCGNLSSGKFIFELDHDDDITPNCFETILNASKKYPDAHFFYSDCVEAYEDTLLSHNYGEYYGLGFGSYYMRWWNNKYNYVGMTSKPNPHTLRHIVGVPNHFRCWTREAYIDVGSHNFNLQVADDYELIIRTFLKYKFCHVPDVLYIQYRNSGGDNFTFHRNALIQYYVKMISTFYNNKLRQRFEELGVKDNVYNTKYGYDKVDWEVPYIEYKNVHYVYNPLDNDETPLVSIIIDINKEGNIKEKLSRSLDCIFNQSYKNVEVVIVGNKDTKSELDKYMNEDCKYKGNSRIRWTVTFKQYNDVHTCKNYGVKMLATAKFITYMKLDSEWDRDHLKIAMNSFKTDNTLQIVIANDDKDDFSDLHIIHHKDVLYKVGLSTDQHNLENRVHEFNHRFTQINTVLFA